MFYGIDVSGYRHKIFKDKRKMRIAKHSLFLFMHPSLVYPAVLKIVMSRNLSLPNPCFQEFHLLFMMGGGGYCSHFFPYMKKDMKKQMIHSVYLVKLANIILELGSLGIKNAA